MVSEGSLQRPVAPPPSLKGPKPPQENKAEYINLDGKEAVASPSKSKEITKIVQNLECNTLNFLVYVPLVDPFFSFGNSCKKYSDFFGIISCLA